MGPIEVSISERCLFSASACSPFILLIFFLAIERTTAATHALIARADAILTAPLSMKAGTVTSASTKAIYPVFDAVEVII